MRMIDGQAASLQTMKVNRMYQMRGTNRAWLVAAAIVVAAVTGLFLNMSNPQAQAQGASFSLTPAQSLLLPGEMATRSIMIDTTDQAIDAAEAHLFGVLLEGDSNDDDIVSILDFTLMADNFGRQSPIGVSP